jgi:hypothetical protein
MLGDTLLVFQVRKGAQYHSKRYADEVELEVCGEGRGR